MKSRGLDSIHSWCVVVACSFIYFLLVIPLKMNSLLFVSLLDRFDTDRKHASMPFSIAFVVRCTSGPIVACLGNIFGIRSIVFIGSCLATVGILVCFFAEEILTVVFSFGIFYGFGMSLGATLLLKIVKQHFEKNLVFAFALMNILSSIVTMIFYPLVEITLQKYGLSGTFLIISGLMLNAVPISIFLRDPKYNTVPPNTLETVNNESKPEVHVNPDITNSNCIQSNYKTSVEDKFNPSLLESSEQHKKLSGGNENLELRQIDAKSPKTQSSYASLNDAASSIDKQCEFFHEIALVEENQTVVRNDSTSLWQRKIIPSLQTISVFCDPRFINIILFESVFLFITNLFFTIIIDASRDKGISRNLEISYLTFLPFSQLCGSLILGWVTNKTFLTTINCAAISFLSFTISCQIFLWSSEFPIAMIAILMFGFFEAGYNVSLASVLFEFTDEAQHSMALGSIQIFYLPLGFTMPSVIGYFRGTLGSYDGILHLLTAMSLAGFVSVKLLPCISRFHGRHKT